ncbi:MAG: hypothetical protein JWQ81_2247 [Amycolatopsis sp.]|nr:hypothetical protein [Amycolatopsis sp.]
MGEAVEGVGLPAAGHLAQALLGAGLGGGALAGGALAEVVGVAAHAGDERSRRTSLEDPEGVRPRIFLQQVPEGQTAKNRLHLDVRAAPGLHGDERMAALEAECERLVRLGATRLRRDEPAPSLALPGAVLGRLTEVARHPAGRVEADGGGADQCRQVLF